MLTGNSASVAGGDKSHGRFSYVPWEVDLWALKLDENGNKANTLYDPDGDDLTWAISGGADASFFDINETTGKLTFAGGDYENPQDADQNNTYEVHLRATDPSGFYADQSVTVRVEDRYEPSQPNHFVDLNSTVALEMIWVEPGTFTMESFGSSEAHDVTLTNGFILENTR